MVKRLDFFKKGSSESSSIVLQQLGTDVTMPIDFIQDEKSQKWMIVLPEDVLLQEKLKAMLAARGKYEIDPQANRSLATPRDTMRTFFEEYERWEEGGKKYVLSTLNLSEVDPAIHEWQAPLLSYYLKSVLDRISTVVFQEIPNDPKSKKPYNIVIAPYTVEGKTVWQFAPQTLSTIDELYGEIENVKEIIPTKEIKENNLYFKLKSTAKSISPLLLQKIQLAAAYHYFYSFRDILAYPLCCDILFSQILYYQKMDSRGDNLTVYQTYSNRDVFCCIIIWSASIGTAQCNFFFYQSFHPTAYGDLCDLDRL
jgi:hypothetical protein